jgi:hypothetical protein
MMATDLRAVVFQALRGDSELQTLVAERIVQRGSWENDGDAIPDKLPYLVYALSDEASHGPSAMKATRRYLMVWAHDEQGDYYRIDQILERAKAVLHGVDHFGAFMEIRFLGKSPDLYDDMLKHLVRYSRFYATLTE